MRLALCRPNSQAVPLRSGARAATVRRIAWCVMSPIASFSCAGKPAPDIIVAPMIQTDRNAYVVRNCILKLMATITNTADEMIFVASSHTALYRLDKKAGPRSVESFWVIVPMRFEPRVGIPPRETKTDVAVIHVTRGVAPKLPPAGGIYRAVYHIFKTATPSRQPIPDSDLLPEFMRVSNDFEVKFTPRC